MMKREVLDQPLCHVFRAVAAQLHILFRFQGSQKAKKLKIRLTYSFNKTIKCLMRVNPCADPVIKEHNSYALDCSLICSTSIVGIYLSRTAVPDASLSLLLVVNLHSCMYFWTIHGSSDDLREIWNLRKSRFRGIILLLILIMHYTSLLSVTNIRVYFCSIKFFFQSISLFYSDTRVID
jgi:hypothetical protein